MTLILSAATEEYVVQVSDRRLTWISDPKTGQTADDDSNKAVLFEHRMAFAYTGLAEVEGIRTDKWLTRVLANANTGSLSEACAVLRAGATDAFRQMALSPDKKRHAFVGIGWTRRQVDEPFQPIIIEISNAQDEAGEWLEAAREEFKLSYRTWMQSENILWKATGQRLDNQVRKTLERSLRTIVKKAPNPESLARVLVKQIRDIASKNISVGQNLLVVSLPKRGIPTTPGHHGIPF